MDSELFEGWSRRNLYEGVRQHYLPYGEGRSVSIISFMDGWQWALYEGGAPVQMDTVTLGTAEDARKEALDAAERRWGGNPK